MLFGKIIDCCLHFEELNGYEKPATLPVFLCE